jgi:hypothetical protein
MVETAVPNLTVVKSASVFQKRKHEETLTSASVFASVLRFEALSITMPPRIPHFAWIKADVYPLIGCVAVGSAFFIWKGYEHLSVSPVRDLGTIEDWERGERGNGGTCRRFSLLSSPTSLSPSPLQSPDVQFSPLKRRTEVTEKFSVEQVCDSGRCGVLQVSYAVLADLNRFSLSSFYFF